MDLPKAIKAARVAKGISQEALGQRLGVSKASVAQWEAGTKSPDRRRLAELARVLGLSAAEVIGMTDGPAAPAAPGPPAQGPAGECPMNVPVFGTAPLLDKRNGEFEIDMAAVDFARRLPRIMSRKDIFAIHVHGTSMSPWREPGQLIYLEQIRPPRPGDYVVVRLDGEMEGQTVCLLKRLVTMDEDKVVLEQHHPHRTLDVPRKQIRAMLRVLEMDELLAT